MRQLCSLLPSLHATSLYTPGGTWPISHLAGLPLRFPPIKLYTFVVKFSNSFSNHPSWDQHHTFSISPRMCSTNFRCIESHARSPRSRLYPHCALPMLRRKWKYYGSNSVIVYSMPSILPARRLLKLLLYYILWMKSITIDHGTSTIRRISKLIVFLV